MPSPAVPSAAPPPLARHGIFASGDADETRAFLRGKAFSFEMAPRERPALDVRINGVYLPGTFIGYIQYGARVEVRATPARDDYWIQVPLAGVIETTTGSSRVSCDSTHAALCAPGRPNVMRSSVGSSRFNVSLTRAALDRHLGHLLGDAPRTAIDFAPAINLSGGYGRSLARQLRFAVGEFDDAESVFLRPRTRARLEELLLTGLLLGHPHNFSDALQRLQGGLAPRVARRVTDYIHDRLCEELTLADLVAHAGVPGRTLFTHFRDAYGISPMRYLKNARLDAVRTVLAVGRDAEAVSTVAMRHGFTHLGRFAADYRRRFGETPSQTRAGGPTRP